MLVKHLKMRRVMYLSAPLRVWRHPSTTLLVALSIRYKRFRGQQFLPIMAATNTTFHARSPIIMPSLKENCFKIQSKEIRQSLLFETMNKGFTVPIIYKRLLCSKPFHHRYSGLNCLAYCTKT